ncbi:MAG: hypothetical protein A4S09_05220 [Proteobacteria bacterium SG_bin7]|nr:MAG: hypothetical protein A4S09_05220 [Proteobacteria bacterium SG_bin7]
MYFLILLASIGLATEVCKNSGQVIENTKDLTGKLICRDENEKLTREENYTEGKQIGIAKKYYESGKVKEAYFTNDEGKKTTFISFDENGKMTSLKCARESVVPQDREYCGYNGKISETSLYSGDKVIEKVTHFKGEPKIRIKYFDDGTVASEEKYNGKKSTIKTYFQGGKLKSQSGTDNEVTDGKEIEYFENGNKAREAVWAKGKELRRTTFFTNGKRQKVINFKNESGKFFATVEEFFDKGTIRSSGKFLLKTITAWWAPDEGKKFDMVPVGLHKIFYEKGKLNFETNYDNKGTTIHHKEYDILGKVVKDEKK